MLQTRTSEGQIGKLECFFHAFLSLSLVLRRFVLSQLLFLLVYASAELKLDHWSVGDTEWLFFSSSARMILLCNIWWKYGPRSRPDAASGAPSTKANRSHVHFAFCRHIDRGRDSLCPSQTIEIDTLWRRRPTAGRRTRGRGAERNKINLCPLIPYILMHSLSAPESFHLRSFTHLLALFSLPFRFRRIDEVKVTYRFVERVNHCANYDQMTKRGNGKTNEKENKNEVHFRKHNHFVCI